VLSDDSGAEDAYSASMASGRRLLRGRPRGLRGYHRELGRCGLDRRRRCVV